MILRDRADSEISDQKFPNWGAVVKAIGCRYIIVLGSVVAGAIWGFGTDIIVAHMSKFPSDVQRR
jgi:hypothetical protein